jgi:hypothetical protein
MNPLTGRKFRRSVPTHEVGQSDREQKTISEKGRFTRPFFISAAALGQNPARHVFLT